MSIVGLLSICLFLFLVGLGVYLIRTSHRRVGSEPTCGQCGYNLTGSESNRCPECGMLFIDAGVIKGRTVGTRRRLWTGITLILVPAVLLVGTGISVSMMAASRAQMQAIQAQRAAMLLSQQSQAQKQNESTTSPE